MDPFRNKGLQVGISYHALSGSRATPHCVQSRAPAPRRAGSPETLEQGSSAPNGVGTKGQLFLDSIPRAKKGWRSETSHQPQMLERIRGIPALQNGRHTDLQEPSKAGRLASEGGPEGRLFLNSDRSGGLEISLVQTGRENLPVHLPTLRSDLSTLGLYQDPETNSSSRTGAGVPSGDLHRRYTADGRVEGASTRARLSLNISTPVSRLHHKHRENGEAANPSDRVFGFHCKHAGNGAKSPHRETEKDSGGVPQANGGGASIGPRPIQTNWQNECCQPGNPTSSFVLQISTDGPDVCLEKGGPELRYPTSSFRRQQGGVGLVGHPDGPLEREDHPDEGPRADHRIRRFDPRLGSDMPGLRHGRTLVGSGEELAYKLSGAPSGYASSENVCERQNETVGTAQARQHVCSSLHQQPGRDSIEETRLPDPGLMDVVPGEEHTHPSPISAGCTELCSRQRIQVNEGPIRLETGPSNLCQNQQTLRSPGSGPICLQTHQTVPTLLQLATGSICRGRRCLPTRLVGSEGVCQSPVDPDTSGPESGTSPGGRHSLSNPPMEGSALVCSPPINAGGLATPPASTGVADTSGGGIIKPTTSGRMEHIREGFRSQGLSEQATNLIAESWRSKTNKSYDSLFKRWDRWCSTRGSDPFSGPVSEVANFLATLFEQGYQYSSINAYRSAISSVHDRVDGVNVGQHPMVTRLVKGVFNVWPPIPRYSGTWDVQRVLNYLEVGGHPSTLPLKALTLRTVFLLAITRPSRSADLSQLSINRMKTLSNGVVFVPAVLAKQSRQGKPIEEFFFPSFPDNPVLCPVGMLRSYLDNTRSLRGEETKLFVSFIKPHRGVTSSSIARWLKTKQGLIHPFLGLTLLVGPQPRQLPMPE